MGGENNRVTRSRLGELGRPSQPSRGGQLRAGPVSLLSQQEGPVSSWPAQHADQPAVQKAGVDWDTRFFKERRSYKPKPNSSF